MGSVVVSESVRHVVRDESYSNGTGPSIPGGVMHGKLQHADSTLCGLTLESLHIWRQLEFPRSYGNHCPDCIAAAQQTVALSSVEANSQV